MVMRPQSLLRSFLQQAVVRRRELFSSKYVVFVVGFPTPLDGLIPMLLWVAFCLVTAKKIKTKPKDMELGQW